MNTELNWAKKFFNKTLTFPHIVWYDLPNENWSAYQVCPVFSNSKNRLCYEHTNGNSYDRSNGFIHVNVGALKDEHHFLHAILHECRHQWQFYENFNNGQYDGIGTDVVENFEYDDAVKLYFTKSVCEYDALLFAHKHAPSTRSVHWMDLLHTKKTITSKIICPKFNFLQFDVYDLVG